ncbi:hypothetical protein CU044_3386 [Streptomyces sp. L-9-10]|nr:hypothetical protein CU044_3386 [Streptomyces sp. L-9-10]
MCVRIYASGTGVAAVTWQRCTRPVGTVLRRVRGRRNSLPGPGPLIVMGS